MISPSTIGIKQLHCAGRTVRDIVERNPETVSEVWCRNIFRQLLQTLERQYSLQLPHRLITPDTVIFHDDGSPALLPSLISDPHPEVADDLTALARVLHYAITLEPVPAGPLRGRGLEGYSESLITAIDRSLAFDPARRPQSIGELRDLLGIVVFRPMPLVRSPTHAVQARAPLPRRPVRRRRRAMAGAGAGAAVLLAVGLAVFAGLRGPAAPERSASAPLAGRTPGPHIPAAAPAVPDSDASGARHTSAATGDVQAGTSAAIGETHVSASASIAAGETHASTDASATDGIAQTGASAAAGNTRAVTGDTGGPAHGRGAKSPPGGPRTAAAPPLLPAAPDTVPAKAAQALSAVQTARAAALHEGSEARGGIRGETRGETRAAAPGADAVVSLRIRPWGVVFVDGVKRGISPPVKQLVMAPGRHAIRVTNPGARDRLLEVDTAVGGSDIAVDFDGVPPTGSPPAGEAR